MKNLKELGLNPIDEKQAESINGGSIGIPPTIISPKDLEVCCYNIPPMDILEDIWKDLM